jgi:MFS family permease
MFKKAFLLGLLSGVLAGIASLIYERIYRSSLGADFSTTAAATAIMASSILGGILAAVGYWLADKFLKSNGEIVFNFVFTILSFATILAPLATRLPLDVESPELFPGLAVPMHFFPALAWYTLKPLFIKQPVQGPGKPASF